MEFGVLGQLTVRDGEPVVVRRPSHRRLLEILLMEPGDKITSDVLIDRFWRGDPPATARAALHTHISALRKLLGADSIATDDVGYRVEVDADRVDAFRFERLARAALATTTAQDPDATLAATEAALSLWRGSPFRELADDDFARPTIVAMEELQLELLETRAAAMLALDRATEMVPDLEALVLEYPFRERLWEHLMTARFHLGRHAEALRAYRSAAEHLAEIGLEPGERLRHLEERILLESESLRATPHNLPDELDQFVGRTREAAAVLASLESHRLVTIAGAGGSGKTRLALHIAREQMSQHPDGVWFVDLAPTRDPDLVAAEVARAMGLRPRDEDVVDFLERATASANALIVLDNCEHLVESAARMVAHLLGASHRLRILTTSREPLRVPGETVYELRGLEVPDTDVASPTGMLETEAVRLFAARAQRATASFDIGEQLADVVSICRQLDGLPLAIELAAARARSMTPADISSRLGNHLSLLTGGSVTAPERQRTLEATIDWSYRLLDGAQRATLNRLSVFRGGFDLGAAERVTAGAGFDATDIAPVVADLAEKSLLVSQDTSLGRRYRMLETVRQFAEARFRETTHATTTYMQHRDWCLELVDDLWVDALGESRDRLGAMLATEADNVQGALEWCRGADDERSIARLAQALGWHWYLAGQLSTAAARLREAVGAGLSTRENPLAQALLARCLAYAEDLHGARDVATAAVALMDAVERPYEKLWIIQSEHNVHWMALDGDPAAMVPLALQARALAADTTDAHTQALAEQLMADADCWNGRPLEGLDHQRHALDAARSTGDPATINEIYGASLYNYMLDAASRRSQPMSLVREWQQLGTLDEEAWRTRATDWLPWVYMQNGDLAAAEEAASRIGSRTLQGYNRTIYFIARATVSWMRGELEQAAATVAEVGTSGIHRWAHCYYPLLAELAADQGSLEEAQRIAASYLSVPVHPVRESAKLGVLLPVMRAAVEAAMTTSDDAAADLAHQTWSQMAEIVAGHRPASSGSTSILTPGQNLALAGAEMSRLASPDPAPWHEALGLLDYRYYETYARWRLGEALLAVDDARGARRELRRAGEAATASGMDGLRRAIERTAKDAGFGVSAID